MILYHMSQTLWLGDILARVLKDLSTYLRKGEEQ